MASVCTHLASEILGAELQTAYEQSLITFLGRYKETERLK